MQDVPPVTMYQNSIYVIGQLWQYRRETFPHRSIDNMFAFVRYDIDNVTGLVRASSLVF